ncbi:MAG: adenylate/guanylate cyclase domain-containing protein [Candidatus Ozemobacteraceae bacterium]
MTSSALPGNTTPAPADSILTRLFLLLALVVLPLLVAWLSFRMMIVEQTETQLDILRERMQGQAATLPRTATSISQVKALRLWLNQHHISTWDNKRLVRLLDRFEKKYPGAIRWTFWGPDGKVRDIPSSLILPGKRMWEGMTRNFYTGDKMIDLVTVTRGLIDNPQAILGKKLLQQNLGPSFKAENFFQGREKVLEVSWVGRPAWATWDVDAIDYQRVANWPLHIRGGFVMLIYPEKLPLDFGAGRSVLTRKNQRRVMPFPMMMIHLNKPRQSIIDPALPRNIRFLKMVRDAYLKRLKNELDLGDWLAIAIPGDVNIPHRLLIMANIRSILLSRDRSLNQLSVGLILLFLLGCSGVWFIRGSRGLAVSLRWRITGLFLIAILVPVTGLLGFGGWLINREENRLREKAMERMRLGVEGLDLRFRDTPKIMEKDILQAIETAVSLCHRNIDELVRLLEKLCNNDVISNYYLSDTSGKMDRTNFPGLDDFIKRAIVETFKVQLENYGKIQITRNAVEGAVSEEMGKFLGKSGESSMVSRPGSLRYFAYHSYHLYFLGINIVFDGVPRHLVVQLDASIIESYFVKSQFLDNPLTQKRKRDKWERASEEMEGLAELSFFSRLSNLPHFPPNATQWRTLKTAFDRSFELRTEIAGETVLNRERFLYYITPIPSMNAQSFIPCFLTSLKPISRRIDTLRGQLLSLTAIASLVAVILGLVLASSLLGPIGSIDLAVQKVGSGDLSVQLPEMGGDEIGRLSRNINEMVDGLRQRERMRAYVSETVLEAVKTEDQGRGSEGESIEATILFSDIRNFTRLAETHPPKVMFAMLNAFFGGVEPFIRAHHGRIDKFIGDAVMAVFLAKGTQGDPAENAVRAGVDIMAFLREFNRQRQSVGLFPIAIGIGINTGEVLLGDVGSARRKDLTIIGDAVNLASRLETASKMGKHSKIILSETTFERVSGLVLAEEMSLREVRGKSQPVRMFEIISLNGPRG